MAEKPASVGRPATPDPTIPSSEHSPAQPPRRGFFSKCLALLVGGVVTLVPPAAGLWFFSDPLARKLKAKDDETNGGAAEDESEGYYPVGPVASIPDDGSPRFVNIMADKTDAWTLHRDVPIGAVYVRRVEPGSDDLQALNASCPHLGCAVSAMPNGGFSCPCHDSEFEPDGDKKEFTSGGKKTVALRGLDELDVKVRETDNMVMVRFQNFRAGIAKQVPA